MIVIGLCGGSGSGKGTCADVFALFGIPSIDTDRVYREMTESSSPCLDALALEFGEGIISPVGALDRQALRRVVFESADAENKRKRLNEITHKFILGKTREMLASFEAEGRKAAIVDAPLLFESGFDKECEVIVSVVAEESLRILRIMKRDSITRDDAIRRIKSQLSDSALIERSDYSIVNNGDLSELHAQVKDVVEQIFKK